LFEYWLQVFKCPHTGQLEDAAGDSECLDRCHTRDFVAVMLNDAGKAGDVQRWLTIVSRLAGRPSDDLEAHERC